MSAINELAHQDLTSSSMIDCFEEQPVEAELKKCIRIAEENGSTLREVSEYLVQSTAYQLEGDQDSIQVGTSVSELASVYGYWYYSFDSVLKPTRYARVELWEENVSGDLLLAEASVHNDGYFLFPTVNLTDPSDIFVKLYCHSHQFEIVRVVNSNDVTYWSRTSTRYNVTGGGVDMGNCLVPPQGGMCWVVYDNIIDGYFWLLNQTGWNRSEVFARIEMNPTGSYCTGDGMIIHPNDVYEREVALHEYGHCVHYEARGGSFPWKGYHPLRYPDSETDAGWALTEGWAEFFQCAVDNDPILAFGANTYGSLETTMYADGALGHGDYGDWDGNVVEGAVAQVFWDIFDAADPADYPLWGAFEYGDHVCNQFTQLLEIFLVNDPNSLNDIWTFWDPKDVPIWSVFRHARIDLVRNIAVTNIIHGPSVVSGTDLAINITVLNYGDTDESFNLRVSANETEILLLENTTLQSQSSETYSLNWSTAGKKGDFVISAEAVFPLDDFNMADNFLIGGVIMVLVQGHDLCVSSVAPSITYHGVEYSPPIRIRVRNWGIYSENFNVTLSTNMTVIGSQTVSLEGGDQSVLTFPWDTAGLERGNHTITAYATSVPSENNTADNTLNQSIFLTLAGDIDADFDVDIFDIVTITDAYGSQAGEPTYEPNYDLIFDDEINIFDIVVAVNNYGEHL
jgi:hypothetical protein